MIEWITGQPFLIAAAFLTGVAGFRSQCTYWLGRGIRAGLVRTTWAKKLTSDKQARAVQQLEKWGWPIIPASFLTVGFQSAIQLTAGLVGWGWLAYTLAALPGWVLWGVIYAAGGLAVFVGLFTLANQAWWLAVMAVLALIVVIYLIIRHRRKSRPPALTETVAVADNG